MNFIKMDVKYSFNVKTFTQNYTTDEFHLTKTRLTENEFLLALKTLETMKQLTKDEIDAFIVNKSYLH